MKPIFAMTLREGAEAARCNNCLEISSGGMQPETIGMIIGGLVGLAIMISIAVIFAVIVRKKIREKKEFSGVAWGLVNGVLGIGILPTILALVSINNEIAKVKNKKYAKYIKEEIKKFIYIYFICLVFWILIGLAIRPM